MGFGSETIRKPQVAGSIPVAGSKRTNRTRDLGVLKRVCPLHGDRTRGLAPFARASERLCELARELGSIPVAGSSRIRHLHRKPLLSKLTLQSQVADSCGLSLLFLEVYSLIQPIDRLHRTLCNNGPVIAQTQRVFTKPSLISLCMFAKNK